MSELVIHHEKLEKAVKKIRSVPKDEHITEVMLELFDDKELHDYLKRDFGMKDDASRYTAIATHIIHQLTSEKDPDINKAARVYAALAARLISDAARKSISVDAVPAILAKLDLAMESIGTWCSYACGIQDRGAIVQESRKTCRRPTE